MSARASISFDSMPTDELRQVILAAHRAGCDEVTVGLNGPDKWTAVVPPLYVNEANAVLKGWAAFVARRGPES